MKAVAAYVRLLLDVFSIKLLVRMLGNDGELLDSHLFLFDKYSDLADYHRSRGRIARAAKLAAIAEWHFQQAPDDPPEAAAMAMPVPRPLIRTDARGARVVRGGPPAQRFGPSGSPTIEVGVLVRPKTPRRLHPREAEPGPSAMVVTDVAGGAFYHADLRVGEPDGSNR